MVTKKGITQLFKNGLSGLEAGKLVLANIIEDTNEQEVFLSQADIDRLRNNFKTDQEQASFNSLIDLYRVISSISRETHVLALKVQQKLYQLSDMLNNWRMASEAAKYKIMTPVIITQKQLNDMTSKQKERKLKDVYSFRDILCKRFYELHADDVISIQELSETNPEQLYSDEQLISQQLLDALRMGHLHVINPEHNSKRVESLLANIKPGYLIWAEMEATWSNQQARKLLSDTFISGEDLYNSGFPEWKHFVDEYQSGIGEDGIPEYAELAVLYEPNSSHLTDADGYYKNISESIIDQLRSFLVISEDAPELMTSIFNVVTEDIRLFLRMKLMFESTSTVLGLNLDEGLDEWYDEIARVVEYYNMTYDLAQITNNVPDNAKICKIDLEIMKPTQQQSEYAREQISQTLEDRWLNGVQDHCQNSKNWLNTVQECLQQLIDADKKETV